jgi:hypothetical protein
MEQVYRPWSEMKIQEESRKHKIQVRTTRSKSEKKEYGQMH